MKHLPSGAYGDRFHPGVKGWSDDGGVGRDEPPGQGVGILVGADQFWPRVNH